MGSILDAVGNTPLVELRRVWDEGATGVRVMVKLEGSNPGGSVKDRPALGMIRAAIEAGRLKPGMTILEPTSGNTGIGMAMVAAALGYRIKLVMPSCASEERKAILLALGAELELTPGCEKTDGAIRRARHIMETEGALYYSCDQYSNEENWKAHFRGTAPEIETALGGCPDAFVAGIGTTGTIMGCARWFARRGGATRCVAVEPERGHRIQGLKNMEESIVPSIFAPSELAARVSCSDEDAFQATRDLAVREGLFCGTSSGAAVAAALRIARDLPRGSTVVALSPDRGDRYLSTQVFRSTCALCPP